MIALWFYLILFGIVIFYKLASPYVWEKLREIEERNSQERLDNDEDAP